MRLIKMASSAYDSVAEFARLERVLAIVCMFIPVILVLSNGGRVRGSISAYYNMTENQMFYFPLTVASMLFVVNGIVKRKHFYNTTLGVFLAGVILFNHIDFKVIHFTCAAGFFLGNAAVIVIYSSKKELWFKVFLVAIIAASLAAWQFDLITLFWAEWISLAIISFHYILESYGVID